MPAGANRKRRCIWALRRRMQPWEAARPIVHGSFVPCTPIGPRWSQLWRTVECAEIPSAATPNAPVGLSRSQRSLTTKRPVGVGVRGAPTATRVRSRNRPRWKA